MRGCLWLTNIFYGLSTASSHQTMTVTPSHSAKSPASSLRTYFALLVGLIGALVFYPPDSAFANNDFRVVGYLPYYRVDTVDPVFIGSRATDVIYFGVVPNPSGSSNALSTVHLSTNALNVLGQIRQQGARTTLGVAQSSSVNYAYWAADAGRRSQFANQLAALVAQHNFQGVDFDWEFPDTASQMANYQALITETKNTLPVGRNHVSVAWPSSIFRTPRISQTIVDTVDQINLMNYGPPLNRLTFDSAADELDWVLLPRNQGGLGLPADKINLGTPFYGRYTDNDDPVTYRNIAAAFNPDSDVTLVTEPGTNRQILFNGVDAVEDRTRYAMGELVDGRQLGESLGGVMIWEVGQDTFDNTRGNSLLHAIHTVAPEPSAALLFLGGGLSLLIRRRGV